LNKKIGKADSLFDNNLNAFQSELNQKFGSSEYLYDKELGMYQSELNKQIIEGGGKADYFDGGIIDITKKL
jgi:hypothetical protein